jgi:uncharacterized protein
MITNKQLVELFFLTSHENDVETAMSCFADDGIWISPDGPEPGRTYKMDEIEEYLVQQIGVLHDFHRNDTDIHYEPFVESGDKVYVEATVKKNDGEVLGRFVDVFTMTSDGKIAIKDVFRKA